MAGGSGSGKATALLNLMKQQNNDDYNIIDKIYLYVKDRNEAKCQYLIKKHEEIGLKEHEDTKAFIEYSNNMQNVHTNIEEYNPNRKRKVLIVRDDTALITQSFFAVPNDVKLTVHIFYYENSKQTRASANRILSFMK